MTERFWNSQMGAIFAVALVLLIFALWLTATMPIVLFDAAIYWKITGKSLIGASPVQKSKGYSPERNT